MFQARASRTEVVVGEVRDTTIGVCILRALVIISDEMRPDVSKI